MSVAISVAAPAVGRPYGVEPGQVYELGGVGFEGYEAIGDALPECPAVRMIYIDGRLTFVTTSRRHDWIADRFGEITKAVALGCGVSWEAAGRATFRRKGLGAGIEGDRTFYFGAHARIMRGGINIDLEVQPPPDLAVEVEVSHPADSAMLTWGRLGVPEVWRIHEEDWDLSYWLRHEDGSYARSARSLCLPMLSTEDVTRQLRLAEERISSDWFLGLHAWVRDVIAPRQAGQA